MLWLFVRRDLREQYAGTLLGGAWAVLQPLLQIAVYWWVFGVVWALKVPALGERDLELPFAVFLLCGLLPWLAFQEALNKATGSVLAQASVLRHGPFPMAVFPLSKVLAVHLVFAGLLLVFAGLVAGAAIRAEPVVLLGLVVVYSLQVVLACGLGLLLAAIAVYLRDLQHLIAMLLMFLFFTAPILYPLSQVPEVMRTWMWVNPFTPFVVSYHSLLLAGTLPSLAVWGYLVVLSVSVSWLGRTVFRRLRPGFADVV